MIESEIIVRDPDPSRHEATMSCNVCDETTDVVLEFRSRNMGHIVRLCEPHARVLCVELGCRS